MTNELSKFGDHAVATLQANAKIPEGMGVEGWYHVVCRDKDGNIKWEEGFPNLVVAVGKQYMLNTLLTGSSYTATAVGPWLGLISSTFTFAAADTLGTSTNGTSGAGVGTSTYEFKNYSAGSRPQITFGSATSSGLTPANITSSTATPITFTISGSGGTVAGCFLCFGASGTTNTWNSTTGTLYSEGAFGTSKTTTAGDTVSVTYSTTATS